MMVPKIIKGAIHTDARGSLFYNNDFDATAVKRIYIIENQTTDIARAWRGHKIEERWFSAIMGSFEIQLIAIDDWAKPSKHLERLKFQINAETMAVLHIPAGYVSSIQSLQKGSKLLVMANYLLAELDDEYRYEPDYFE
jgi:dTDP-4-dehydrorhamnose 3,5-epimerase-like enzyme